MIEPAPPPSPAPSPAPPARPAGPRAVRAIMLGDRIDTNGLERSDALSTLPLAFRVGADGVATVFRYGVVVFVGLSPLEEDEVLRTLRPRVLGAYDKVDDESAFIEIDPGKDDSVLPPGGRFSLKNLAPERLLVVADALGKSVALARDEREVSAVMEQIEPSVRRLSRTGRTPGKRRDILRLIGNALHVQHRMSGRVAVEEKPDVLWDRPDLERLYARLEDEYELRERATALSRKLDVLRETAQALTDIIDTERSLRLEITIVALILFEIIITFYQMWAGRPPH